MSAEGVTFTSYVEGLRDLEASCQAGFGPACHLASWVWYWEDAGLSDKAKAKQLAHMGCELKDAGSCAELSLLSWPGSDAVSTRERACELGHLTSCELLASYFQPSDVKRAQSFRKRACELGRGLRCGDVATFDEDLEVKKTWDRRACLAGSGYSCHRLIKRFDRDKDPARASAWHVRHKAMGVIHALPDEMGSKTCDGLLPHECKAQANVDAHRSLRPGTGLRRYEYLCRVVGFADACLSLAIWHRGRGQWDAAIGAYERACASRLASACRDGATLIEARRPDEAAVRRLRSRAVSLWEGGCTRHEDLQCVQLVQLWAWYNIAPRQPKRLFETILRSVTRHGFVASAYPNLATIAARGIGIPGDSARARAILKKGCEMGHPIVCNSLAWTACYDQGECTEELEVISKESSAHDYNGYFYGTYAYILCQRGKVELSRVMRARACRKNRSLCQASCPAKPPSGTLSQGKVYNVIRGNFAKIQVCYERELAKNTELGGKVIVQFKIKTDGRTRHVKTTSDTLGSPKASACILGAVASMQFPKPQGGEVQVTFPFIFKSM